MFSRNTHSLENAPAFLKIDHSIPHATYAIVKHMKTLLGARGSDQELLIVCIGTDRSTGDALGPLVGSRLQTYNVKNVKIFGTLENPVHAMNLSDTIENIRTSYHDPYIIAVDACLGSLDTVGKITIGAGSIKPGAGVKKQLPEVGDLYITGTVNVGGFMEYLVLQNTRLNIVMNMAAMIARSLSISLSHINHDIQKTSDIVINN